MSANFVVDSVMIAVADLTSAIAAYMMADIGPMTFSTACSTTDSTLLSISCMNFSPTHMALSWSKRRATEHIALMADSSILGSWVIQESTPVRTPKSSSVPVVDRSILSR